MTLLYIVHTYCIHGCRLKIYNIIVIIKLDQRDFNVGCVLIESYLKNNIRLTVLRDENKTSTKVLVDFSSRLCIKLCILFYTSEEKHCTKIKRITKPYE